MSLGVGRGASGQTKRPDSEHGAALTRFVPHSAHLFLSLRRLDAVDAALSRAHAWRFLPILSGGAPDRDAPINLRESVGRFFGFHDTKALDELFSAEAVLVASSWLELGKGVWLVRLPDEGALARWFPVGRRLGTNRPNRANGVRFFRTSDGVAVCAGDGVVALSRTSGPRSLFAATRKLMVSAKSMLEDRAEGFADLTMYLPDGAMAVAYVGANAVGDGAASILWLTNSDRAVVALYEGQGRIDVVIQASVTSPAPRAKLSTLAVTRLVRLPQTTLFAAVSPVAFNAVRRSGPVGDGPAVLDRYLDVLGRLRDLADDPADAWPDLGPHVTLAWDQDLRPGMAAPQVAMLMECTDPSAVRRRVRRFVDRLLGLLHTIDAGEGTAALVIDETNHLNVPIWRVSLADFARGSKRPLVRMLSNVEPAWTVFNDTLIVALSREHIEHVLDAWFGLVPTLASVEDVQALRARAGDRSMLSIMQPGVATKVWNQWLEAFRSGKPSLLDPARWELGLRDRVRPPWGIVLEPSDRPGEVHVADVEADPDVSVRIQPGDHVVGINGRLLSLESSTDDLETRLRANLSGMGPTLRVRRGDALVDVTLPRDRRAALTSGVGPRPADAVSELASLGRILQFASFSVNVADDRHYAARLSLRFTRPRMQLPADIP